MRLWRYFALRKPRLHGDGKPSSAEHGTVAESEGAAVPHAILAGGLGLHHQRSCADMPGWSGQHLCYGPGAEDAGYIIRERVRNANGRLGSIEYTILEQPRPPEPKLGKPERENPVQVKPVLDSPVLGKPEQEKPAQLNTKGSSNQISNTDSSSTEGSNPIQSSPQTPQRPNEPDGTGCGSERAIGN